MKSIGALLLTFILLATAARAEGNDPEAVTKAAYETAMAHFGFTPETVKREKAFFTPDLYAALMKKASQPVAKGDAPDLEGDVLFDSQDLPEGFRVNRAVVTGTTAHVPVSLSWGKERRQYDVQLVQINGAWKISDIDYGKDGKLSDLVK
jgi:hypothetical protein